MVQQDEDAFGQYEYDDEEPQWPMWVAVGVFAVCAVLVYWG